MNDLLSAIGTILLLVAETILFALIIIAIIPFSVICAVVLAVAHLWDFLLDAFKNRRRSDPNINTKIRKE